MQFLVPVCNRYIKKKSKYVDGWAHNFGREIHSIMFCFYFGKQGNYVNNLLINEPETLLIPKLKY